MDHLFRDKEWAGVTTGVRELYWGQRRSETTFLLPPSPAFKKSTPGGAHLYLISCHLHPIFTKKSYKWKFLSGWIDE